MKSLKQRLAARNDLATSEKAFKDAAIMLVKDQLNESGIQFSYESHITIKRFREPALHVGWDLYRRCYLTGVGSERLAGASTLDEVLEFLAIRIFNR